MSKRKPEEQQSSRKSLRKSGSGTVLPNICIFCDKESKYLKGKRTRDPLRCCSEFRVDKRIRTIAEERHDAKILSIAYDELIAKEARYHSSCYKEYTRPSKKLVGCETVKTDLLKSVVDEIISSTEGKFVLLEDVKTRYLSALKENTSIDIEVDNVLKNIKRSIERNITNAKLLSVAEKEIVCSDSVTREDLLGLYLETKTKLEQVEIDEQNIMTAAKAIRREIKNCEYEMSWPPLSEELAMETFPVFQLLQKFLSVVLTDEAVPRNERYRRIISSFSQDIFFAANQGKVLTPKSVILPMLIKSLTNNTELITTISRLGHGVSYTKLSEITTEVAYSRINKNDGTIFLPQQCTKGTFTILVEDNIDRNEETLTGHGTTHKVNSIIIQEGKSIQQPQNTDVEAATGSIENRALKRRSLNYIPPAVREYIYKKRKGPKTPFKAVVNEARDLLFADQHVLNLAWLLSRRSPSASHIPSWTGYHIQLRKRVPVVKNFVGYLDCLDAPATEMSTVYHMMERALRIRNQLEIDVLVCVYDQAIYAKALEIQLKEPTKFSKLFLMMGTFHVLLMFLGVIGARFKDAGMKDVYIQSGIVAEGSVDSVLRGKQYNRAIRAHKIFFEALWCLMLERFESEIGHDAGFMNKCTFEEFENLTSSPDFKVYLEKLYDYQDSLCNESDMWKYWYSFLSMMENLLCIIYATRTGDWILYVESIRELLPWTFAYDRQNYARYLSFHFMEMTNLEEKHKVIYDEFMKGNFTVQLSDKNPFGKQEADKVIETTINKDTKTPGGTTGK